MISLEEHNKRATERHGAVNKSKPHLNGIACPECGEELYDTQPTVLLMSDPPKKNIGCSKCKYSGFRIA